MRADQVHIQSPCAADWDAMRSDIPTRNGDPARFCTSCQKHVHDLSTMTRRTAETLLEHSRSEGQRLCVRYRVTSSGHLRFPARPVLAQAPAKQQHGVSRLLRAAALIAAATFSPLTTPSTAAASETSSDIEEQLWSQERAAAQKVAPLGLTLEEEEHYTHSLTDPAFLYITPPVPPDEPEMMMLGDIE